MSAIEIDPIEVLDCRGRNRMTTDRAALEKVISWARVAGIGGHPGVDKHLSDLADAAQAHLDTLPKVRTTATWQVQYVRHGEPRASVFSQYHEARSAAEQFMAQGQGVECVHVVGPIMHCVPA